MSNHPDSENMEHDPPDASAGAENQATKPIRPVQYQQTGWDIAKDIWHEMTPFNYIIIILLIIKMLG